jgi:ABC-type nitrate/sulfonate/bicarbonate transport system substrate-binding protein
MTPLKGLKGLTIVAALLAGGTSLAMAQGPGTGDYPPVAGGAGGNPITNPGYYVTGGYAPRYVVPGYAAPGYVAPGYARPYAGPRHRNLYMLAPGSPHKRLETGQIGPKQPRQAH